MCVPRFHARAGYLQTYETLLKLISSLPGSDKDQLDQYPVECVALADHNFNCLRVEDSLFFTDCHDESSTNDVAKSGDVP